MATPLLDALLLNESGGRNIPNVTRGTSSGQAQGYFQITEGTWKDFGGTKYAANPLGASYAQQAEIAAKIPLKRWDKSTVARMQATGKKVDPNLTLGENLVANGENIATTPDMVTSGGAARHPPNPTVGKPAAATAPVVAADTPPPPPLDNAGDYALEQLVERNNPFSQLASTLSNSVGRGGSGAQSGLVDQANAPITPAPEFAKAAPDPATLAPVGLPTDTPLTAAKSGLGELFKLADNIGQAAALNTDAAGMPIRRRTYG